RGTAARRCYSPEWIRCHRVTREITVAVIDTGINHENRTDGWLTGIPQGAANVDPLDVFPVRMENGQVIPGDGVLDLSAGHGSFGGGTVKRGGRAATIRVSRGVDTGGRGRCDDIAIALAQPAREGADIINLPLGTMPGNTPPPLAFTTAVDTV